MQDEYVEITEQEKPAPVKVVLIKRSPILDDEDIAFFKRMENWRRTVLGSLGGGGGGYCAGWARLYVAAQLAKENDAKQAAGFAPIPQLTRVAVDELDGWLIEAAVRSLGDYDQRKVLQYWYVRKYPKHWIQNKLMLRKSGVMLVLGRAQLNLKNILRNLNSAANILSNNLHAGVDPRPETKVAPEGSALSPEKEKALNDSSFGAFCIERSPDTFKSFPSIFSEGARDEVTDSTEAIVPTHD